MHLPKAPYRCLQFTAQLLTHRIDKNPPRWWSSARTSPTTLSSALSSNAMAQEKTTWNLPGYGQPSDLLFGMTWRLDSINSRGADLGTTHVVFCGGRVGMPKVSSLCGQLHLPKAHPFRPRKWWSQWPMRCWIFQVSVIYIWYNDSVWGWWLILFWGNPILLADLPRPVSDPVGAP